MKTQSTKWAQIFSMLAILVLTFSTLGVTPARAAGIRYTKPNATGSGNCSSWANACTLQTALTGSTSGDEIWVAVGTHKPTTGNDRNATFQLKNGVAVYGGFAGTETARDQRDPATNLTVLSGDLNGDDVGFTNNVENTYHVVTGATGATLDGFTITAGNADGADPQNNGGGMYNSSNSPILINIIFINNRGVYGGGMLNDNSNPSLTNITFKNNGAFIGGGLLNYSSSPRLDKVSFIGNYGDKFPESSSSANSKRNNKFGLPSSAIFICGLTGGGVYNYEGNPRFTNVTFYDNTSCNGAGMFNYTSDPILTNVTFEHNLGLQSWSCGGIDNYWGSNPQIRNTIFWNNTVKTTTGEQICGDSSVISDSVVQGGCPVGSTCTNIITTDPLLGALGNYGGFTQTIPLLAGSSAIDTGNNATCAYTDQRGVTRPVGTRCDIGAFEYNPVPQVVVSASSPTDGALVVTETKTLKVVFNKDVLHDGSANAANNPINYLLVEAGANGNFDTLTCKGRLLTDDSQLVVNSISYDASTYTATLNVNGGTALPNGNYRLFICGTTSITDLFGLKLNYGLSDTPISFRITTGTGDSNSSSSKAKDLPSTGFAPDQVSILPMQPAAKVYSTYSDLTLEIPTLGIKASIVGVPEAQENWDVTWLGNNAGWLNGTAFPTWNGNSVITGHVWDANNHPGIFVNLKKLKYGDRVKIHAWGQVYIYEVRENLLISPSSVNAALKHEDQAWVTLLTCEDFNILFAKYSYRRMIRAVLLSISAE